MQKIIKLAINPTPIVAKMLLAALLISFFALGFLGYLIPIKEFLDSIIPAFTIGKMRFSAYTILKSIFSAFAIFWTAGILNEFSEKKIRSLKVIKSANRSLLAKGIQIVIYFASFVILLKQIGIDLTAFAVFSGAIGIGLGFGLQKIASNFVSGIILLFEQCIEEGHLIELIDGATGIIKYIGARYTLLETFDNRELIIPNEYFVTNVVTNWTLSNTMGRISIDIAVPYDTNLKKAVELVLEAANENSRCMKNPSPSCYLTEFGQHSANLTLNFWIEDVSLGRKRPQSDIMFSILEKFSNHDISIAAPQMDLCLKTDEPLTEIITKSIPEENKTDNKNF